MAIKYTRTKSTEAPKHIEVIKQEEPKQEELKNEDPNKEIELQPNNPLHGIKLAEILDYLVTEYGWESLGEKIKINCFISNPSINSSLKFLRRTNWAREKVERLYIKTINK
jgi:uncharacterized protein (DUF2132 family)